MATYPTYRDFSRGDYKSHEYDDGSTYSTKYSGGFYSVGLVGLNPEEFTGWKVHASFSYEHTTKAFDLAAEYLVNAGVKAFKIADPAGIDEFSNPDANIHKGQAGKMLTIYHSSTDGNYKTIISDLEKIFLNNKIEQGLPVIDEREIKNSSYFYYRNDTDLKGNYIDTEKDFNQIDPAKRYNPHDKPDPFENIDVSHVHRGFHKEILDSLFTHNPAQKGFLGTTLGKREESFSIPYSKTLADKLNDLGIKFNSTKKEIVLNSEEFEKVIDIKAKYSSQEINQPVAASGYKKHDENSGILVSKSSREIIVGSGIWEKGRLYDGDIVSRVPVSGLSEYHEQLLFKTLEKAGMEPERWDSASLGKTIRVSGPNNVEKIDMLNRTFIGSFAWGEVTKHGDNRRSSRLMEDPTEFQKQGLSNALVSSGLVEKKDGKGPEVGRFHTISGADSNGIMKFSIISSMQDEAEHYNERINALKGITLANVPENLNANSRLKNI